jgi:hypothetical protein
VSDLMFLSPHPSGSSNRQPGNLRLRKRAAHYKHRYQAMRNSEKATFANEIFQAWRNETTPPGRFLKRVDGILYEVPEGEAIRTIQVLMCREPSSPPSRRATIPPPRAIHLAEYPLPHPPPPEPAGAQVPAAPRSRFADAGQPDFMSSKRRSHLRLSRNVLPGCRAAPAPTNASSSLTGGTESTESSASSGRGGGPADSCAANGRGRPVARLTGRVKKLVQRLFCGSLVRSHA